MRKRHWFYGYASIPLCWVISEEAWLFAEARTVWWYSCIAISNYFCVTCQLTIPTTFFTAQIWLWCSRFISHTHIHAHTHTRTHTHIHARTHTRTHMRAHTCAHTHIHTCMHMHTHTHRTHIHNTYSYLSLSILGHERTCWVGCHGDCLRSSSIVHCPHTWLSGWPAQHFCSTQVPQCLCTTWSCKLYISTP